MRERKRWKPLNTLTTLGLKILMQPLLLLMPEMPLRMKPCVESRIRVSKLVNGNWTERKRRNNAKKRR
jgi:hypothetical protein